MGKSTECTIISIGHIVFRGNERISKSAKV